MKSENKQKFIELLSMLSSVFDKGLNDQQVKTWWSLLEEESIEDFEAVAIEYMRADNAFMPKPGQIISLIQLRDGRPSPEAAFGQVKYGESDTNVWTDEMATAFWASFEAGSSGDMVAARMAFLEVYRAEVTKARAEREKPHWTVSLGHDPVGREQAIKAAVECGKLSAPIAQTYLPHLTTDENKTMIAEAKSDHKCKGMPA